MDRKKHTKKDYFRAILLSVGFLCLSVVVFVTIKYYFSFVYKADNFQSLPENNLPERLGSPSIRGISVPERNSIQKKESIIAIESAMSFLIAGADKFTSIFDLSDTSKPLAQIPLARIIKVIPTQGHGFVIVTTNALYLNDEQLWSGPNSISDIIISASGELFVLVDNNEIMLINPGTRALSMFKFDTDLTNPKLTKVNKSGTEINLESKEDCIKVDLVSKTFTKKQCPKVDDNSSFTYVYSPENKSTIISLSGRQVQIPGFQVTDDQIIADQIYMRSVNIADRSVRLLVLDTNSLQIRELQMPINGIVKSIATDELDLFTVIDTGLAKVVYWYNTIDLPDSFVNRWKNTTPAICESQNCDLYIINY